jgi:hypothetical protein
VEKFVFLDGLIQARLHVEGLFRFPFDELASLYVGPFSLLSEKAGLAAGDRRSLLRRAKRVRQVVHSKCA